MGSTGAGHDDLRLRDATTDDVPALVALVQSAYRGADSRTGWTTEAHLLDGQRTDATAVARQLAPPDSRMLVVGHPIVACCHLERRSGVAHFGMFAVAPAQQAAGLGRRLLAAAEGVARDEWTVPEMHMQVISVREELIQWYERRGYRRTGTVSPFPYEDERFGLPRRNDLVFELLVKDLGLAAIRDEPRPPGPRR